jgi:peroxiredoxin
MIRLAIQTALLLWMIGAAHGVVHAAVAVGDSPELKARAVDGTTVDLSKLRGKLVLVDFWVGRSDDNKTNERALVEIAKDYKDKGLETIGICCDRKIGDAQRYIAELKITWPQIHEPADWQGGLGAAWGVQQVNWDVLIAPDGKVVYAGDAKRLRDEIDDALKKDPPQLVDPAVLAKANQELDAIKKLLATRDLTNRDLANRDRDEAIRRFTRLPEEAGKNPEFAKRASLLRGKVNEAADQLLGEVDAMIAAKKYPAAADRLRELLSTMAGLPTASLARQRLAELVSNPEIQQQLKLKEKQDQADAALAEARKLRDASKPQDAYTRFKAVATDYPGTPAGDAAAEAVKTYEADPAFVRKVKDAAAAPKAKPALSLAANYRSAGKIETARKIYQDVISQFPGTSFADDAQKQLDSLNR